MPAPTTRSPYTPSNTLAPGPTGSYDPNVPYAPVPTSQFDPSKKKAADDAADRRRGGFEGFVIGAGKDLEDMFGAEGVNAYNADPNNFNLGERPGLANERAATQDAHARGLESQGFQVAGGLRAQGQQGLSSGQQQATKYNALGIDTAAAQGRLADQYAAQGQSGNALQQARALGFGDQGQAGLAAGSARAGTQQGQATNFQNQFYNQGQGYADNSALAMSRNGVTAGNSFANAQNRDLEAQGRQQQLAAAQALGYRANDGYGDQATQGFRDFAAQTGNGPSAAQAQLQQGADQSMSSALALARSGRGNNTAAVRQAMFQNAATQQATNQQLGTLRAQEFDQAQNRQLGALGQESSALQAYRGQDLNALQGAAGVLGQARGQDQSQQQLGIGQGQFDANLALQNRQLNDATALGWAGQQQQAGQQQLAAWQAGQQLGNASIAQGQNYNANLQGLGQQASQAGQQFQLGAGQLQNTALGQGQQFQLGAGQLANQSIGQGQNYNLGAQGLANNYALGNLGAANQQQAMANQTLATQLSANMGYEGMQSQNYMAAQMANQQADTQRDSANTGMMTGLLGGMMMSDRDSKRNVKKDRSNEIGLGLLNLSGSGFPGLPSLPGLPEIPGLPDPSEIPGLSELPGVPGLPGYRAPEPKPAPAQGGGMGAGGLAMMSGMMSDEHSKRQISSLKGELADVYEALGGRPRGEYADAYQGSNMPDTLYPSLPANTRFAAKRGGGRSYDDALALGYQGGNMPETEYPSMPSNTRFAPRVDMRPAQGFSYTYKDPSAPGAAAGRHYGPMAQDLEKSPATASTVVTGPDGMKRVDTPRLTMVNTAALSDQQRDIQAIKAALASNNNSDPWHPNGDVDVDALDEAQRSQGGVVMTPWRQRDPLANPNLSWRYQAGF